MKDEGRGDAVTTVTWRSLSVPVSPRPRVSVSPCPPLFVARNFDAIALLQASPY
jgi:hypothetical protein